MEEELAKVHTQMFHMVENNRNIWRDHCIFSINYGTAITQLMILILDSATDMDHTRTICIKGLAHLVFMVISSQFGVHSDYLDGLGVFYVPWGVRENPQEDLCLCEQVVAGC